MRLTFYPIVMKKTTNVQHICSWVCRSVSYHCIVFFHNFLLTDCLFGVIVMSGFLFLFFAFSGPGCEEGTQTGGLRFGSSPPGSSAEHQEKGRSQNHQGNINRHGGLKLGFHFFIFPTFFLILLIRQRRSSTKPRMSLRR